MTDPLKVLPLFDPIEEAETEAACDALEGERWQRTHYYSADDDWESPDGPAPRVTLRKTIVPPDWD